MPEARMNAWIRYLESKGIKFEIGTGIAELKLFDNNAKGLYSSHKKTIYLEKTPDVSTFYEECYHALQDLYNHPESGTVYENGGTIYDNVDLWEYDAKKRILSEEKQIKISKEEKDILNTQIQQVLHGDYGNQ